MKKHVMVTTLFKGDGLTGRTYYYFNDKHGRIFYCDALIPVEAACKFMLFRYQLDEIVVNVPDASETEAVSIREGQSLFASAPDHLSDYDFLRCRLAAFAEDIHSEDQDLELSISEDAQKKITEFIHDFFLNRLPEDSDKKGGGE